MSTPLRKNRDYGILWGAQAASEVGFSAVTIVLPLLVLVVTGSAAASGLAVGASAAAQLIAGLPAGALVDRWDRKTIMLLCEAGQALAAASIVLALWLDVLGLPHIVAAAAVMGLCRAFFEPAEHATLPRLVPAEQVHSAVAGNAARGYLGQLSGTALGGVFFSLARAFPFVVDMVLHLFSFTALLFLRTPAQERSRASLRSLLPEIGQGLRWVWGQRFIRATAACLIGVNFFFTAFYIVIIVLAHQRGLSPAEIGVMAAMFGIGGLLGALAAPTLTRLLTPYLSIVGVFVALTLLTPVAVVIHNGYLMGLLLAGIAFLAPTANTTITTYQLLLTPDPMRGRFSSVMAVLGGGAAAAGPAVGGVLVELAGGTQVILLCTAGIAILTILALLSPALRAFPDQKTLMDAQDEPAHH
ncbi:MFS transporter [Actinokineospora sp. G85]|uniref:MFS transporter n=1 Tax=Actinokineospora sp. G85 TaxID=3406626 RepID=UPI003C742AEC